MAVTSAVVGSMMRTLPASCSAVVVDGKLGPSVKRLMQVKKGGEVVLCYTDALAISVKKAKR